ncbi:MAG: lytic transglycosylase domain-containing protein [Myxococcales bacterium]|jgi:soluble lytic murein transglycosylase
MKTLVLGIATGLALAAAVWPVARGLEREASARRLQARLEGRLQEVEARLATSERAGEEQMAALLARLSKIEQELADMPPEQELWIEAERLGIAAEIGRSRTGLTPRQEYRVALAIVREARRNQLDPLLVTAVIRVESNFDSYAVSHKGALGLMQLMPATGTWLAERANNPVREARYLFDFERNVELGCAYLAELIARFGKVEEALLAYNVGPGAARAILAAGEERRRQALAGYPAKVLAERARLERRARVEASPPGH